jgi:hypothetical protein
MWWHREIFFIHLCPVVCSFGGSISFNPLIFYLFKINKKEDGRQTHGSMNEMNCSTIGPLCGHAQYNMPFFAR